MPVYEYRCSQCDKDFEHFHRSSDVEAVACPACGSRNVQRKVSAFASPTGHDDAFQLPVGGCGRCGNPDGPCSL